MNLRNNLLFFSYNTKKIVVFDKELNNLTVLKDDKLTLNRVLKLAYLDIL